MRIEILSEPFEPFHELAVYQQSRTELAGRFGACANFIGSMRDLNEGDTVRGMLLEHYPGMTDKHLRRSVDDAADRWPLLDVLVLHRVGELLPNDPIVLVAVWSAHRAAAFDACRFIMEDLKSKAPFWKKESTATDTGWVEAKETDEDALKRW